MHNAGTQRNPGRHDGSELNPSNPLLVPERRRSRRDSQRRRKFSRDSKKLQKSESQRTYSFSPGRNDSIRVLRLSRDAHRPPVPSLPTDIGDKPDKGETTAGAPSQQAETSDYWQRMPTLHKRRAQDLPRRKSSKKRKEEHNREEEIRAMVSFMPQRPAVDSGSSGRPMKRDSKKMRTGLKRNFQNPHSDISLPTAESMHSSVSSNSDYQTSYKLSALESLAPRPTLRYAENPRYAPGASGFGSDRSESQRRRISDRIHIPEEVLKANKRIDELADDLDARELRELMERDQKRREKKKIAEKMKMEKRLARRQEKDYSRGQSSISQRMDVDKPRTPSPSKVQLAPAPAKQASEIKAPQSWTSFFRRNKRSSRASTSSFSNTSRETVLTGPPPQVGYTPIIRQTSNVPKRTMSKFREDLPELPLSPPDSRVQSPEADTVPPIRTDYLDKRSSQRRSLEEQRRHDTPISAMRLRDSTPTSGHRSTEVPSPEPAALLSQSLASIDSEGSWLSGKKTTGSKRGSMQTPLAPLRDSASSLQQRYKELSESSEELGIAEDEYFSRITPGPFEENMIKRGSTGQPMASSDEDDSNSVTRKQDANEKTKWGAVARHPTVVHREPRAKSREGFYDESGSEAPGETPISLHGDSYGFQAEIVDEENSPGIRHVRRVSAGSARLLDLKPRVSQEAGRTSLS
ncbi:Hydrocephalus-inducing like protein [Rutstroemia sp. NJR-2017a BBW]|nr:Hydrocephalus-inducing like protein [Rutstroemia sp. NJR-2017a BBW]